MSGERELSREQNEGRVAAWPRPPSLLAHWLYGGSGFLSLRCEPTEHIADTIHYDKVHRHKWKMLAASPVERSPWCRMVNRHQRDQDPVCSR